MCTVRSGRSTTSPGPTEVPPDHFTLPYRTCAKYFGTRIIIPDRTRLTRHRPHTSTSASAAAWTKCSVTGLAAALSSARPSAKPRTSAACGEQTPEGVHASRQSPDNVQGCCAHAWAPLGPARRSPPAAAARPARSGRRRRPSPRAGPHTPASAPRCPGRPGRPGPASRAPR